MTTTYDKIDKADWSFLGTWREEQAMKAAERVYYSGGREFSDSLDDLKQHALLYCATHPKAINAIQTEWLMGQHVASRLARDFRREWDASRERDNFGTETELYGEDYI